MNEGILQATATAEPSPAEASIPSCLERTAARRPDSPAILCGDKALSYRQLLDRARDVGALLAAAPGPVALLLDHGPEAVVAMLGTLRAGRAYVPLDPDDPPDRMRRIFEDSGAARLVTRSGHEALVQALGAPASAVVHMENVRPAGDAELPPVSPDAIAYIYYTSGSTGRPKGVPQTHRTLLHHAGNYARALGIRAGDRVSLLFALSFSASIMDIYGGLLSGATVCPFNLRRHGMARLAEWIDTSGIQVLHTIPTVFRHLLATAPGRTFAQVRGVDLAGEPVFADDVDRFRAHFPPGCRLVNHLAASEAHVIAQWRLDDREHAGGGALPVGPPAPGVEARIVLPDGTEAAAGEAGELEIRSRFTSPGYWNDAELTARSFADDPRGEGWRIFRTSDRAMKDEAGRLLFLGRKDARVKVRGHSVDPSEVEAVLHRLDCVRDGVVVPRTRTGQDGRHLAAFVIPADDGRMTRAALRRHLREHLPPYMIPEEIAFVDRFPATATGKIDRKALSEAAPVGRPEAAAGQATPMDDFEYSVAERFKKLLSVQNVGRDDHFFDLGGDSLKASELQTELLRHLGVHLELPDLIRDASVRGIALALRRAGQQRQAVDPVLLPVRTEGTRPKLFLVHGALGQAFVSPAFLAALGPDQPVFAFRARGLDGREPAHRSVTAMAMDYQRALEAEARQRTYVLCGLCSGGLITLEMARRLHEAGRGPATVVLIDPPRTLIEGNSLRRKLLRSGYLLRARRSLRRGGSERTRDLMRNLRRQESYGHIAPTAESEEQVNTAMRVALDLKLAVLWHRPRPYPGPVSVLQSRQRGGKAIPGAWRRHVRGEVRLLEAGAKHGDLLLPGNLAFATQLRQCIEDGLHEVERGH